MSREPIVDFKEQVAQGIQHQLNFLKDDEFRIYWEGDDDCSRWHPSSSEIKYNDLLESHRKTWEKAWRAAWKTKSEWDQIAVTKTSFLLETPERCQEGIIKEISEFEFSD